MGDRRDMNWRRVVLIGVVMSISSLLGLLLVEGTMRLAGLDYARIWEPDAELGWHHVAGARRLWTEEGRGWIHINSLGQRDRERTLEKAPGTYRILVYGDSMTEAVQVDLEQTFPYLLEESLRKSGYQIEVLNMGVNGYSPIQEVLLLKREGKKYHADMVVLATYLDNDVSGSHPRLNVSQGGVPFYRGSGGGEGFDFSQTQSSYDDYQRQPVHAIRYYSAIYRWLSAMRWQRKASEGSPQPATIPRRYLLYADSRPPEWDEAWRLYERALDEFASEVSQQSAELVVLSVPAAWVASAHGWDLVLNANPVMKGKVWDLHGPENRLKSYAEKQGWRLVAPYQAFGEAWSSEPLYWSNLGHMTPRGHQVMARELEKYLVSTKLIPHG